MNEKVLDNIRNLTDKRKSEKLITEAVKELKFNKTSIWQYIISLILAIFTACIIGFSTNTVVIMTETVEIMFNTSLAIIGIVLGAYSIFQALLQDELILLLIYSKNNILKDSNLSFLNIVILHVSNVIISFIVRIILRTINTESLVLSDIFLNNICASFIICLYLFYNFLLLLEIIVFTINLYRMFCIHNTIKGLNALNEDDKKE